MKAHYNQTDQSDYPFRYTRADLGALVLGALYQNNVPEFGHAPAR